MRQRDLRSFGSDRRKRVRVVAAKNAGAPVTIVPLLKETNGPRLSYRIGMGVRYSDQEWKRDLNRVIKEQQPVIDALLQSYGVPLVDESNNLITPAAATK